MALDIDLAHPTADAVIRAHVGRLQELINSIYTVDIVGGSGAGSRTANGAVVGDTLLAVLAHGNTTSGAYAPSLMFGAPTATIATVNTVDQVGMNFTGAPLVGILMKTNV